MRTPLASQAVCYTRGCSSPAYRWGGLGPRMGPTPRSRPPVAALAHQRDAIAGSSFQVHLHLVQVIVQVEQRLSGIQLAAHGGLNHLLHVAGWWFMSALGSAQPSTGNRCDRSAVLQIACAHACQARYLHIIISVYLAWLQELAGSCWQVPFYGHLCLLVEHAVRV
jgi:hypothetical protein